MTHGPSALGANSATTSMTPQAGAGGYDPSTFRTGFTPGGGTGFTPGFGGMMGLGSMVNGLPSFPLPSPNTAAFLSMVTNNTPGAGGAGETSGAGSTTNGGGSSGTNTHDNSGQGSSNGDGSQSALSRPTTHGGPLPGGPNPSAMVDITPNTLNALTGVINQMDQEERQREEGRRYSGHQPPSYHNTLGPHGPPPPGPPPPPAQRPNGPDMPVHPGATLMHHADSYFPQQHHQQQQQQMQQGGPGPHNGTGNPHQFHPGPMHGGHHHQGPPGMGPGHPGSHGTLPPSHLHQGAGGPGGMRPGPGMDYVRTDPNGHPLGPPPGPPGPDASGAVNGLFLLSQAHQELSKREEQEQHVDPPKPVVNAAGGKKGGKAGNKRKTSDAAAPAKAKPAAKKSKKNVPVPEPPSPDFMNSFGDSDDDMGDMNGYDDDDNRSARGDRKPETEEEKRKNFLERNRQGESGARLSSPQISCTAELIPVSSRSTAALKCRQRKKAWLSQLQTKVDGLSGENERLRSIIQNLTDEVGRISAVLSSHRDCPGMPASMAQLGISLPPPPPPGSQPHGPMGVMMPPGPPPPGQGGYNRHGSAGAGGFGQPQAV